MVGEIRGTMTEIPEEIIDTAHFSADKSVTSPESRGIPLYKEKTEQEVANGGPLTKLPPHRVVRVHVSVPDRT